MLEERLRTLEFLGADMQRVRSAQVLALPENIASATRAEDLLDTVESATLSKELKAAGLTCYNSLEIGLDAPGLDRRGADLWLGTVWVLEHAVMPIVVAVILMRIARFCGTGEEQKSTCRVHLSLKVPNDKGHLAELDYDGDAKSLELVLSGLGSKTADESPRPRIGNPHD